jgi:hypothetical protein
MAVKVYGCSRFDALAHLEADLPVLLTHLLLVRPAPVVVPVPGLRLGAAASVAAAAGGDASDAGPVYGVTSEYGGLFVGSPFPQPHPPAMAYMTAGHSSLKRTLHWFKKCHSEGIWFPVGPARMALRWLEDWPAVSSLTRPPTLQQYASLLWGGYGAAAAVGGAIVPASRWQSIAGAALPAHVPILTAGELGALLQAGPALRRAYMRVNAAGAAGIPAAPGALQSTLALLTTGGGGAGSAAAGSSSSTSASSSSVGVSASAVGGAQQAPLSSSPSATLAAAVLALQPGQLLRVLVPGRIRTIHKLDLTPDLIDADRAVRAAAATAAAAAAATAAAAASSDATAAGAGGASAGAGAAASSVGGSAAAAQAGEDAEALEVELRQLQTHAAAANAAGRATAVAAAAGPLSLADLVSSSSAASAVAAAPTSGAGAGAGFAGRSSRMEIDEDAAAVVTSSRKPRTAPHTGQKAGEPAAASAGGTGASAVRGVDEPLPTDRTEAASVDGADGRPGSAATGAAPASDAGAASAAAASTAGADSSATSSTAGAARKKAGKRRGGEAERLGREAAWFVTVAGNPEKVAEARERDWEEMVAHDAAALSLEGAAGAGGLRRSRVAPTAAGASAAGGAVGGALASAAALAAAAPSEAEADAIAPDAVVADGVAALGSSTAGTGAGASAARASDAAELGGGAGAAAAARGGKGAAGAKKAGAGKGKPAAAADRGAGAGGLQLLPPGAAAGAAAPGPDDDAFWAADDGTCNPLLLSVSAGGLQSSASAAAAAAVAADSLPGVVASLHDSLAAAEDEGVRPLDPLAGWHDDPDVIAYARGVEKRGELPPQACPVFVLEIEDLNAAVSAAVAAPSSSAVGVGAAAPAGNSLPPSVRVLLQPSAALPHVKPLQPTVILTDSPAAGAAGEAGRDGVASDGTAADAAAMVDADSTYVREFLPPHAPVDGQALHEWLFPAQAAGGGAGAGAGGKGKKHGGAGGGAAPALAPIPRQGPRLMFCLTLHQRGVDVPTLQEASAGYLPSSSSSAAAASAADSAIAAAVSSSQSSSALRRGYGMRKPTVRLEAIYELREDGWGV